MKLLTRDDPYFWHEWQTLRALDLSGELHNLRSTLDFVRTAADYYVAHYVRLARAYRAGEPAADALEGNTNHVGVRWRADVVYMANWRDGHLMLTNRDYHPLGSPSYCGVSGEPYRIPCVPASQWPAEWPRYSDSYNRPRANGLPRVHQNPEGYYDWVKPPELDIFDDNSAPWNSKRNAQLYQRAVHALCDFLESQQMRGAA